MTHHSQFGYIVGGFAFKVQAKAQRFLESCKKFDKLADEKQFSAERRALGKKTIALILGGREINLSLFPPN